MVGPGGLPQSNTFNRLPCPTFAYCPIEFQGVFFEIVPPIFGVPRGLSWPNSTARAGWSWSGHDIIFA